MALVTPDSAAPRIFASPLARRLAREAGLDLSAFAGSGPHGRVIERDVKSALAAGAPRRAAAAQSVTLAEGLSAETTRKFYAINSYEEVPHNSMRKAIARRLTEFDPDRPAFLSRHRLRDRRAPKAARGLQRSRPERRRRQAGVEDFGQ